MQDTKKELTLKYIDFLRSICLIETPSDSKESIDEMVTVIENFALSQGYKTERIPFSKAGDFLLVKSNCHLEKRPVMLMAHMDTVHKKGAFGEEIVKIDGNTMVGPGVIDCKGGIATAFYVLELLQGLNVPVKLLLTSDEEVGGIYSGQKGFDIMVKEAKESVAVLNLESGSPKQVTVSRKGILKMVMETSGVSGHAGNAYFDGANAIKEAAHAIIEIEEMSKKDGITFNCGVISGGTVANVIPDKCEVEIDIRVVSLEDVDRAQSLMLDLCKKTVVPNTKRSVKLISSRPPMLENEKNLALLDLWNKCAKNRGIQEYKGVKKGGGSDAAYTVMAGVPTLCSCAMEGSHLHTINEKADLSSLEERVCLICDTIILLQEKQ
ncbi:MAG: M20/M25/M40 family metallo-hydrolase [Clostridia bacterium]|nr:M20/M25/M40 family metallo-hydrolase [Clostridia bacterium]